MVSAAFFTIIESPRVGMCSLAKTLMFDLKSASVRMPFRESMHVQFHG
jgi:hypothetical protein